MCVLTARYFKDLLNCTLFRLLKLLSILKLFIGQVVCWKEFVHVLNYIKQVFLYLVSSFT